LRNNKRCGGVKYRENQVLLTISLKKDTIKFIMGVDIVKSLKKSLIPYF